MDDQRIDRLAKVLAGGVSRRGVLRGAAGALAAAVGLSASQAGARTKVPVCHYTGSASNPWQLIEVAEPAYDTHRAHGDGLLGSDAHCGACGVACEAPATCGGGGIAGQCGCTPTFTSDDCDGMGCGAVPDGCGGTVTCGCLGTDICGGGGVAGVCGCSDDGSACADKECGTAINNCGDTVNCGPLDGVCLEGQECQGGTCVCTASDPVCTPDMCGQTLTNDCGVKVECDPCTVTFAYAGAVQTWTVPTGATQATFDLYGAEGAPGRNRNIHDPLAGGLGGHTAAVLGVVPGMIYQLEVGGRGNGSLGGFNGGGAGVRNDVDDIAGGGGGGGTDVRVSPFGLGDRLLVAGGGGGGGTNFGSIGGGGGGVAGGNGGTGFSGQGGSGGTATAGGAGGAGGSGTSPGSAGADGTLGTGGAGGPAGHASNAGGGGGGGGGLYGGGGGGGGDSSNRAGAGGGGSGYITPSALSTVAFQNGVRAGDGLVTISYRFD